MTSLARYAIPVPASEPVESVRLRSVDGSTEAQFVPEASMACSSLRYLGAEYLHQGDGVGAYPRVGMTMGIRLLHPWANRLNGFRYRVAGHPLYHHYVGDRRGGQVLCQGVTEFGGGWYVVAPSGHLTR